MTSKLFHTVVGFGIALGAATMGCSAEQADGSVTANSAETATSNDTTTPAPKADPFCEVGWPTTKGGPRPAEQQTCIDPTNACGAYPNISTLHTSWDVCTKAESADKCQPDGEKDVFQICKAADDGTKAWACPAGTIRVRDCTGWITDPATAGNDNGTDTATSNATVAENAKAAGY